MTLRTLVGVVAVGALLAQGSDDGAMAADKGSAARQPGPSYSRAIGKRITLDTEPQTDQTSAAFVFGPRTYSRTVGGPVTDRSTILGDPAADYIVEIDDGASQGADGSVTLNGEVLLALRTRSNVGPRHIRRAVTLGTTNTLEVRLTGKPGSTLTVSILGGAKTIGVEGGTVMLPGGGLTLTVPEGAIETPSEIHIVPLAGYLAPPGLGLGPTGPGWRLEPAGQLFAKPVTVQVSVASLGPPLPAGAQLSDLRFIHFAESGAGAEVVEPRVLATGQTLEFDIRHFSSLVFYLPFTGDTDPENRWETMGLKWSVTTIKWYLEPPSQPTILTVPEIEAAFAQWQAVSSLRFEQTHTKSDAQIVFIEQGNISWTILGPICWVARSVYGQTCFPSLAVGTLDATDVVTIHMASEDVEKSEFHESDIRSSLLHEIGHALGIGHTPSDFWLSLPDPAATAPVMSAGAEYPTTLRQADIDAVRHLYPIPVIAIDDQYQMTQGGVLTVPAPGLMANDTYPPGATIEFLPPFPPGGLTNVSPYNGGFILDMSWNPSFTGPLPLQYIIHSTSGDSNVASVTVQVTPAPPALMQISGGNNQVGAPTGMLPNAVSVLATNQFGNPVGQVPVTFRVTSGGGCVSGSPTGTNCQSELATFTNGTSGPLPGKAGVFWKLGALVGTQTIEVTSPGLSTITFTATASATGPAPTPFTVSASGLPEDIPNPGSITRRMLITTKGTISSITLFFEFPAQCERNHFATLTDPGGRTVVVMDRGLQRCSGVREPYSSINVGIAGLFDGRRADGEWIFTIQDLDADAYSGTLNEVTLTGEILSTSTAQPVTIFLGAVDDRNINDLDSDLIADTLGPQDDAFLRVFGVSGPSAAFRAALEFNVSAIPAGSIVNSATLSLHDRGSTFSPPFTISLYGFIGDGVVSVSDGNAITPFNFISSYTNNSDTGDPDYVIDVKSFIQYYVDHREPFAGVLLRSNGEGGLFRGNDLASRDHADPAARPRLVVSFSPPH